VAEEVRYRTLSEQRPVIEGCGTSLDMSSRGILFTTSDPIGLGHLVEIAVSWPAKLGGSCPLKLVARGRVIRAEPGRVAVSIDRYEFRTRRVRAALAAQAS